MNKCIAYAIGLFALLLSFLTVGSGTSYAANTALADNFSSPSGSWDIIGINHTPTITNGAMQLTSSGQNQVGTIWLKDAVAQSIKPPYTVTFRFLINGADRSNVGADGIVFMFNKKQNTSPVTGGGMGFQTGNGYGIEFDTYSNPYDPSVDHISLFKNNPDHSVLKSNLLAQVNDTTFENAQWHNVKINVDTSNVKVYLDDNLRLNWSGTLDSSYSGIGLTASTGFYYNTQTIDDIVITKPANATAVNSTLANGAYPAGTIIPIQLTFNDTIQVTGAPILALNTGRNAAYASGSGTNTLTFNYTVQAGDNLSSLNYASNAALSLNGGTLFDGLGNSANLSLVNAANSLGASKLIALDTALPTVTASITGGNPGANLVTLNLSTAADVNGSGLSQMRFSNDNATWSAWEAFAVSKAYSVLDSTSVKKIYTQVKDKANNISNSSWMTINPPIIAVPGSPFTTVQDIVFNGQLSITNPDHRTNWQLIMTSSPSKGTVTLGTTIVAGLPKATFIYTPNANVNGTDSFSFKLSDGVSYSNAAKVDLSITAVNQPPVAINRSLSVVEDVPITFSVTATDIDSPTLTFLKEGDGTLGTVALLSSNGLFSYTPNANANGTDTFQFKVFDGEFYSTGTVSVTIQPVNDAPVASNMTITTLEDKPTVNGKLAATDVESNSLTYHLVSNGTQGKVTINSDGSYVYMPNPNINGTDTFTFIANDGLLDSNIATVNVNITPVNDPPSFNKGLDQKVISASVEQYVYGWATAISSGPADESGQTVHFIVTVNDTSLFAVQPTVSPSGTLSFTPKDNVIGSATIDVTLHDNGGSLNGGGDTSSAQQFVITISNVYVSITGLSISPADVWVKDHVTVTANVYSSIGGVDIKKWAIGIRDKDYFETSGTIFTDSFPVSANGTYTIYAAKDSNYDLKQMTITQIDHDPPVLELLGDASVTTEAGTPFVDPGAQVTDNSLPYAITISALSTNVNPNVVGNYTMEYVYTDQAGNQAASIVRSVHVIDTTAPVITLLGVNPLTVAENTALNTIELGATVKDNTMESLTSTYPDGVLNLKLPGRYDLVYSAKDSSNNTAASVTRTVYVTDITAPTIDVVPIEFGWTAGKVTISATFNGTGSNIVSERWAAGAQSVNYFASADPTMIHTIIDGSFDVTANNSYTIYAEDQYGNKAIAVIAISNIDKSAPSGGILINEGDLFTASNQVRLKLNAIDTQSDVDKMIISNDLHDPNFTNNLGWMNYADAMNWTLLSGDGPKTVYIKFKDYVGNVSDISSANIVLDSIGHPDLSQLSLMDESLSLSPGFDPAIMHYSVTVQSSVSSIDLLPKVSNNLNTISVINGGVYQNGILHSNELSNTSNNGNNPIAIRITTVSSAVYKDYTINVYKLSPRNNITGFIVNGLAADPVINITNHTVSLSVYSQTNLIGLVPQITLSRGATIDFAAGSTNDFTKQVHYLVTAEDGSPPVEWTVMVDSVITASTDLSNLSLDGFPFAFDPATTSYAVDVGPLFDQVTLTAVTADPSAAVAITIADTIYNGTSHNISLSNGNNLIHVVVTAQSGSKSYDINIHKLPSNYNPILGYASSNADGTEAILVFKEALDLSTLTADKFNIQIGDSSHVIVTSVTYDQGSLNHPIVHLKLTGTVPDINNWKLNITGVKTASAAAVNITAFPITSMAKVQQLNTLIDPLKHGVHMDDIILYMQKKQDVTGDNVFDSFDINYLLEQI